MHGTRQLIMVIKYNIRTKCVITQLLCDGHNCKSLQFVITQFCYDAMANNHNYKMLTFCNLPYVYIYVSMYIHTYVYVAM